MDLGHRCICLPGQQHRLEASSQDLGKSFVYLKKTEGETYQDPTFQWNCNHAAGLRVGAYHFFRPADDPLEQVAWFIGENKLGLDNGNLIPVVDIEETGPTGKDQWAQFTAAKGQARVEAFCDALQKSIVGVRPMIYSRKNFIEAHLPGLAWNGLYWMAQYPTDISPNSRPDVPKGWAPGNCKLWQYSCTGSVAGIKGAVDLNRFLGADLSEITL